MNNMKWADVAHMYINAGVRSNDGHMLVECRDGQNLWQYHDEGVQDFPFELPSGDLPILRHLEDMTEDHAKDMYSMMFGDPREVLSQWKRSLSWAKDFIAIGKFEPRLTVWLLSQGFDMFGLIDSDQAIRKPKD